MKKPSKKQVKKYLKNAEIIECVANSEHFNVKEFKDLYLGKEGFECDSYYLANEEKPKDAKEYVIVWNYSKGFAKIISSIETEPKYVITKDKVELPKDFTGWCKTTEEGNDDWLAYFYKGIIKYGFYSNGNWFKEGNWEITEFEIEATPEEVTEALINEAVKRYKVGDYISPLSNFYYCTNDLKIYNIEFEYCNSSKSLYFISKNGFCIGVFKNGVWAEIIPTITKEDAEKELGKKIVWLK